MVGLNAECWEMAASVGAAACGDRDGDSAGIAHRFPTGAAARRLYIQRQERFLLFPPGYVDSDQRDFVGDSVCSVKDAAIGGISFIVRSRAEGATKIRRG